MTMLAITAVLFGTVLGMRFNVLVLLPAAVTCSVATLGIGVTHNNGYSSILLAAVLAIAALQIGYLVGTVVVAGSHIGKDSTATVTVAQRPAV